jgi:molybdopterin/thiamine biosynthesis adenylyltransferase
MKLSEKQKQRYNRNILLSEVGVAGQMRLLRSKVLIIGIGGLGSPVSLYLAAAGVGSLTLADGDVVDESNLQRQLLHFTSDVGRPKVESAAEKLASLNPGIAIRYFQEYLFGESLVQAINGHDFVIDATDNLNTKLAINDACVNARIPYSHGGIFQFGGQTMTVFPGHTTCYRCIYQEQSTNLQKSLPIVSAGPLGPVAGIIGCIQATECLKYLLGIKDLLSDTLLTIDSIGMDFRKIKVKRRFDCPVCGKVV